MDMPVLRCSESRQSTRQERRCRVSPFTHTFRPWRMRNGRIVVASDRHWKIPHKWDRDAAFAREIGDAIAVNGTARPADYSETPRVLVDVDPFAAAVPADVVARLFRLIDATPNLIWVIRTEHPERVRDAVPWCTNGASESSSSFHAWQCRRNLWLAATVTSQAEADERVPELLRLRDLCGRLVVDVVPTEEIDLLIDGECSAWACGQCGSREVDTEIAVGDGDVSTYECHACDYVGGGEDAEWIPLIDLVTIRGEIGKDARPTHTAHVRSLVRQCKNASVPVWVERLGSVPVTKCPECYGTSKLTKIQEVGGPSFMINTCLGRCRNGVVRAPILDRNGADPSEWPEDLRVWEVPT